MADDGLLVVEIVQRLVKTLQDVENEQLRYRLRCTIRGQLGRCGNRK